MLRMFNCARDIYKVIKKLMSQPENLFLEFIPAINVV